MSLRLAIVLIMVGVSLGLHLPAFRKGTPEPWDCTDTVTYNATADGLHWTPSPDNVLRVQYAEWWFFTFIDSVNNIAIDFGYAVHDPDNIFGKGLSGVSSMVYETVYDSPIVNISTLNDALEGTLADFVAHASNATMSIGKDNSITVLDQHTYHVIGKLSGGTSWDLTYTQLADPMLQIVQAPGVLELDWISYMPSAKVSGELTYNGRTYQINNAVGYHDHNFGFWPEELFNWIWANYNGHSNKTGNSYAMVMGAYKIPTTNDTYIGYVLVRYNGEHIKFGTLCGNGFELVPQEFVPWPGHDGKTISVHNIMTAENDKYRLVVDYKTMVWSLNPSGLAMGLLVSEQISTYQIQLYQKAGSGWTLLDEFSGQGFNEWCDTRL